jgi:hypothetical protein
LSSSRGSCRDTRDGFETERGARALLLTLPAGLEEFFADLGQGLADGGPVRTSGPLSPGPSGAWLSGATPDVAYLRVFGRVKIVPGVTINLSCSGMSTSLGPPTS